MSIYLLSLRSIERDIRHRVKYLVRVPRALCICVWALVASKKIYGLYASAAAYVSVSLGFGLARLYIVSPPDNWKHYLDDFLLCAI